MARLNLVYRLIAFSLLVVAGCNDGDTVATGGGGSTVVPTNPNLIACDPFNSQNPALAGHGVESNLYYLNPGQTQYTDVMDYINNGVKAPVTLFLNDINVPTRDFNLGFTTQAGSLIVNAQGNTLYEYFALQMNSVLTLGPNDAEGDYQFAMLSDDGSIFTINDTGNGYRTEINNDGTHPTLMGCGTDRIHMTRSTQIPMTLNYYQGPRYQIAMVLMWRPYPTDPAQVNDPLCGQEGNYEFFNPDNVPSTPEQNYLDLQSRGWQPLTQQNFLLPFAVGSENPCSQQTAIQVTNVQIINLTQTSATVTWTTDLASTSNLSYAPYPSTTYTVISDPTLVTSHSVTVNGLSNFTVYNYYVTSTDQSGGNPTSNGVTTFRTLR